jgi:hypothetical protein
MEGSMEHPISNQRDQRSRNSAAIIAISIGILIFVGMTWKSGNLDWLRTPSQEERDQRQWLSAYEHCLEYDAAKYRVTLRAAGKTSSISTSDACRFQADLQMKMEGRNIPPRH